MDKEEAVRDLDVCQQVAGSNQDRYPPHSAVPSQAGSLQVSDFPHQTILFTWTWRQAVCNQGCAASLTDSQRRELVIVHREC